MFGAALFTTAKIMQPTQVSAKRGANDEEVVHIYNGSYLALKKDGILPFVDSMHGPRRHYAKRSQSEKEKYHIFPLDGESKEPNKQN